MNTCSSPGELNMRNISLRKRFSFSACPEPVLTNHQWCHVASTWDKFQRRLIHHHSNLVYTGLVPVSQCRGGYGLTALLSVPLQAFLSEGWAKLSSPNGSLLGPLRPRPPPGLSWNGLSSANITTLEMSMSSESTGVGYSLQIVKLHPIQEILWGDLVLGGDTIHPADHSSDITRVAGDAYQMRLGPSLPLYGPWRSKRTSCKLYFLRWWGMGRRWRWAGARWIRPMPHHIL